MIDRRTLLGSALAAPFLTISNIAQASMTPLLRRIRIATVSTPDVEASAKLYSDSFDYRTAETGTVPAALAASWGAPGTAGNRYTLMYSAGDPEVYIRLVEGKMPPGYRAMTSFGWNSIEIVVDDIEDVYARMLKSPFTILDRPLPLDGYPSIIAMQVKGPSEEVFYLTMQAGDRSKSSLPDPKAPVGRPFIAVLAGPDMETMLDWYEAQFALARRRVMETPIKILQNAQGLPSDHLFAMGTMGLAEHGNIIEFDEFPQQAGPRHRIEGHLPPGNAMFSFGVADLDAIHLPFITPPTSPGGLAYGEGRTATVCGPAGELIELLEEAGDRVHP